MVAPIIWFGIGIIVVIALVFIYYYNKIVIRAKRIDNAFSQIDVQLKKRADLVPNLVSTVKGYMKHEREIMDTITKTRAQMISGSMKDRLNANNKFTQALKSIFAIAENYPDLKASENFKLLQEQLEGIENKIAFSRQFYNDAIMDFNITVTTVPGKWFASLFGIGKKEMEYLEIEAGERKTPKVEF
jgi:LemA protein